METLRIETKKKNKYKHYKFINYNGVLYRNTEYKTEKLTLEVVKKEIENYYYLSSISQKTRESNQIKAIKMFVKICKDNSIGDITLVMMQTGRERSGYYHYLKEAEGLIEFNKSFRNDYSIIVDVLINKGYYVSRTHTGNNRKMPRE